MGSAQEKPIFIFDFEGNVRENILEYAVVTLSGSQILPLANHFCHQPRAEHFLLQQKKIPTHFTQNAPPIEGKFNEFKSLRERGIFAAHHAATENDLLRRTWANPGLVPHPLNPPQSVLHWGPWIDSEMLYRRHFPQLHSHALEPLIETFRQRCQLEELAQQYCPPDRRKFHCALFDALACALLLRQLQSQRHLTPLQLLWESLSDEQQRQFQQLLLL